MRAREGRLIRTEQGYLREVGMHVLYSTFMKAKRAEVLPRPVLKARPRVHLQPSASRSLAPARPQNFSRQTAFPLFSFLLQVDTGLPIPLEDDYSVSVHSPHSRVTQIGPACFLIPARDGAAALRRPLCVERVRLWHTCPCVLACCLRTRCFVWLLELVNLKCLVWLFYEL